MFEQNGRTFVGMVLQNDTLIVDLSRANVNAPATLKQLDRRLGREDGNGAVVAGRIGIGEATGFLDAVEAGQDAAADS